MRRTRSCHVNGRMIERKSQIVFPSVSECMDGVFELVVEYFLRAGRDVFNMEGSRNTARIKLVKID